MIKINDVLLVEYDSGECELALVVGFQKLINDQMGVEVSTGNPIQTVILGPVCFTEDSTTKAISLGELGEDEI